MLFWTWKIENIGVIVNNILVIDDDERLLSLIVEILQKNGFVAKGVTTANVARTALHDEHFDVIIVDWMMPKESGIDFIRTLRKSDSPYKTIPAIMLTALDDIDHKLQGFENGYDDYVTKPFEERELIARINAITRRTSPRKVAKFLKFGNCEFDVVHKELKLNGQFVTLSTTDLGLLSALAQRPNEPFSRIELAKKLSFQVSERTIDVQITRLRKKIGDNPKNPAIIKTIRYIGYTLCCTVIENEHIAS